MTQDFPYIKLAIVGVFIASTVYVHFRGRVRLRFFRQLMDHSTFMAPINCLMYLFSRLPAAFTRSSSAGRRRNQLATR